MGKFSNYAMLGGALLMSACTTLPNGPSVASLPGTGKSFEQFRYDDSYCRQYGSEQIGGSSASKAANDSLAASAVAGTAIGTVIGAAVGGSGGAAIGAGTGLFVGSAEGAAAADASAYNTQRRYDNAYLECMYAKGHRIPVSGRIASQFRARTAAPPVYYPPPPPPGYAPPPPPGYAAPLPPGDIR